MTDIERLMIAAQAAGLVVSVRAVDIEDTRIRADESGEITEVLGGDSDTQNVEAESVQAQGAER